MQKRLALAALACASSGAAQAQSLYFEDFSSGAPGWTLGAHPCCGVQWKADALPATTPHGPYYSAPASLNYNNDVDYQGENGTTFATSPPIDISGATGVPVLVIWCNNQMVELLCDPHERSRVIILGHTSACLGRDQLADLICTQATWHPHLILLDATWGSIQIQFEVRTDGIADQTQGWFVDDLGIYDAPAPVTYCTAKPNSNLCEPRLAWGGALPSATDPDRCDLFCTGAMSNKNGMFFYGLNGPASVPFMGGTLCIQPPVKRTFVQNSAGTWGCSGYFNLDFNTFIQSGVDAALVPGAQVDLQVWFRDPNSSFDSGLSDGLEFVIQP